MMAFLQFLAEWLLVAVCACGAWYLMRQRIEGERRQDEEDELP